MVSKVEGLDSVSDAELILPPDVSAAALRAALEAISDVVGSDHVHLCTKSNMKPDQEGHYFNLPKEHDLFYVLEKDTFLASAVVKPGSTEDVSAIVKIANENLTPLWPTSMGRNLGMCPQLSCRTNWQS